MLAPFFVLACCAALTAGQRYAERNVLPAAPSPDTYDEYDYGEDAYGFEEEGGPDVYKWNAEEFPHPLTTPRFCNRLKASRVCDPDLVLDREQADLLDNFIQQLYRETPCICDACTADDGGIVVGIALLKHMHQPYHMHHTKVIRSFAETLRFRWKLGRCDNDILIVVATADRMSYTDVGGATSDYLSIHEAHRIFLENKAKFSASNFSEGLMDILQGYYRATRTMQLGSARRGRSEGVDVALVGGVVVGTVLLLGLLLFVGVVIYRRWRGRGKDTVDAKSEPGSSSLTAKDIKVVFGPGRDPPLSANQYQRCGTTDEEEEVIDFTLATPEDASFQENTRLTELTTDSEATLEKELDAATEGLVKTFPPKNNVTVTDM